MPNRHENLARWISDPQHIKPGSYMPLLPMQRADMEPLVAYLESLQ